MKRQLTMWIVASAFLWAFAAGGAEYTAEANAIRTVAASPDLTFNA